MSTPTADALLKSAASALAAVAENPRLESEILLAAVMGKRRAQLLAWPERMIGAEEAACFARWLDRRLAGEPIAYILGEREFWSRVFAITPDVLIPRPETELLVERALHAIAPERPAHILELGTGSGAVAITLALERPMACVTASDVSPRALAVASDNARRLGASNVHFLASDWFSAISRACRFDLVVSNPPYIAEVDPHLQQGDICFEPRLALTSGVDGLDAIRCIVRQAQGYLAPGGWLLLEHGYDQAAAGGALLQAQGYVDIVSHRDLLGHARVTGGRCRA